MDEYNAMKAMDRFASSDPHGLPGAIHMTAIAIFGGIILAEIVLLKLIQWAGDRWPMGC